MRKYLLSRFFLTLILVGLLQVIINIAMRTFILPSLEVWLGLDGMLSGRSLTQAIQVFFSCLITLTLRASLGTFDVEKIFSNPFAVKAFGTGIRDSLVAINEKVDDFGVTVYSLSVVLVFFGLILLWLLPYIIGAIVYSKRVTIKVNELEKARVLREQEYERQRNLLLSDITHDIKTPITTIAGFSQALSDGTVPEDERETYLKAIKNKSMKVSELVSLLFEYIKLDSKGYSINRTDIDFAELVRECIAESYAEFEEKNMNVDLDIPEEKMSMMADKMQLERAINNILSNTIKHNPEGTEVFVSLKKVREEAVLEISDKGTRIETEDAIHLFEPFYLADKSRKSGSGNGLGLSITKKIVEMHGGKVYLIQYKDAQKHGRVKTFRICIKLKGPNP